LWKERGGEEIGVFEKGEKREKRKRDEKTSSPPILYIFLPTTLRGGKKRKKDPGEKVLPGAKKEGEGGKRERHSGDR